jgi:uncharacterized Rmd1/YagE family protein
MCDGAGAEQDSPMNTDLPLVGTTPTSAKPDAAPTLRIRALMLGDRINASGLELGPLVSSTPAAFRVHSGLAVIFRYGVVVLIGLLPSEEKVLIDSLKSRVIGELSPYEEETAQAQLCHDENAEAIQPGGPINLSKFSDERLLLIADALAKSTSLARDERRVAAVFDVIEPFARELAEKGRTSRRRKGILQLIGNALLVQQRVAGRVAVAEKPDVLWEKPQLDRLYARLEDEYELKERLDTLERKLTVVAETADALTEIIDTQRSLRLEIAVVVLIVIEVVIGCIQIWSGTH